MRVHNCLAFVEVDDCSTEREPDFPNCGSGRVATRGEMREVWLIPCRCCAGSRKHSTGNGPRDFDYMCETCNGEGEWTLCTLTGRIVEIEEKP